MFYCSFFIFQHLIILRHANTYTFFVAACIASHFDIYIPKSMPDLFWPAVSGTVCWYAYYDMIAVYYIYTYETTFAHDRACRMSWAAFFPYHLTFFIWSLMLTLLLSWSTCSGTNLPTSYSSERSTSTCIWLWWCQLCCDLLLGGSVSMRELESFSSLYSFHLVASFPCVLFFSLGILASIIFYTEWVCLTHFI